MTISLQTMLTSYAKKRPEEFPPGVIYKYSRKTYTFRHPFPKAIFHYILLPRIDGYDKWLAFPNIKSDLFADLRALLAYTTQKEGIQVLTVVKRDADEMVKDVEQQMIEQFGFKWDVLVGFNTYPTISHMHLHIMSADLVSERWMKYKKHYNLFNPRVGIFRFLDEFLPWLDLSPEEYKKKIVSFGDELVQDYLKLVNESPLTCFRCGATMRTMPALNKHLKAEWDELRRRSLQEKEFEGLYTMEQEENNGQVQGTSAVNGHSNNQSQDNESEGNGNSQDQETSTADDTPNNANKDNEGDAEDGVQDGGSRKRSHRDGSQEVEEGHDPKRARATVDNQ
ncbi:hypothetical protein CPC08DRAFT_809310 [Agrocybe pediades]|nr:hypothetical protein CPC08DRAFT_809310 [Agrocybe pediades]